MALRLNAPWRSPGVRIPGGQPLGRCLRGEREQGRDSEPWIRLGRHADQPPLLLQGTRGILGQGRVPSVLALPDVQDGEDLVTPIPFFRLKCKHWQ